MLLRIREAIKKSLYYWSQVIRSSPPNALYIGGWLRHDNLGDEALYAAYRKIFGRLHFVHYPCVGGRILKIPNQIIKPACCGILAGGTLINRSDADLQSFGECSTFLDNLFVFGTGVGNAAFWKGRQSWQNKMNCWKSLLERCKYVGVRGPLSASVLMDYGIRKTEVVGDPVLCFAAPNNLKKTANKLLGLNLTIGDGHILGDQPNYFITQIILLVKKMIREGWDIKWYVVCPEDIIITERCARETGAHEIEYYYQDYEAYMSSVNKVSVFIGTRLHAVVLAICQYVPSIMIEYRLKCMDFMLSISQHDNTVRIDKIKHNKLYGKIHYLYEQKHEKSEELFVAIQKITSYQQQKAEEIQNSILFDK